MFGGEVSRYAGFVVGWYRRAPWSDDELAQQLKTFISPRGSEIPPTVHELLRALGETGRLILEEWEERRAPARPAAG